jgi:hypothetical protein
LEKIAVGLTDEFYFREPEKTSLLVAVLSGTGTKESITNVAIGDIIIIGAQILVACQIVYEEKYIHRYQASLLC